MSAPRSVWVLVWPDGEPGSVAYQSRADAHKALNVTESYDRAVVRYDPHVASALKPPASPDAVVAPVSQHGSSAVPAGRDGGHEQHDSGAA